MRGRINNFFNPDVLDQIYIVLPLTSKLYQYLFSSKLKILPELLVYLLNKANHDYARKIIDCESEQYLQNFIEKIHEE